MLLRGLSPLPVHQIRRKVLFPLALHCTAPCDNGMIGIQPNPTAPSHNGLANTLTPLPASVGHGHRQSN